MDGAQHVIHPLVSMRVVAFHALPTHGAMEQPNAFKDPTIVQNRITPPTTSVYSAIQDQESITPQTLVHHAHSRCGAMETPHVNHPQQ